MSPALAGAFSQGNHGFSSRENDFPASPRGTGSRPTVCAFVGSEPPQRGTLKKIARSKHGSEKGNPSLLEIHLDPLGGWSGDMFAAAMLDAFPEHWAAVEKAVAALALGAVAQCELSPHRDRAGLTGRRFLVATEAQEPRNGHSADRAHGHSHDHEHAHDHREHDQHYHDDGHHQEQRSWASIRALIEATPLDEAVKREAIAIFAVLAQAEGEVHGVPADSVYFHEVGAVDSIVDIVTAAQLIVLVKARRWTSAPLPLGSGRVRSAHGILPVPAPATALLLRGLNTIDDGIPGERVTPTGAAIARHLLYPKLAAERLPRILDRTGTGFGTREMDGISNCLRALVFESGERLPAPSAFSHRELSVIEFEVDDQSAEDLSAGLDHIRAMEGVHDVIQSPVFGKKGRLAVHVQALVAPDRLDEAIACCFSETTTIGLRFHRVQGAALPRSFATVEVEGRALRTKMVLRPDGARTAKTEASDVAAVRGHQMRQRLRRDGEQQVLAAEAESTA